VEPPLKDDIPELASGEARASLGHSSSDLWTHVHEAFIDNCRAVPAIATQHRIFIDPVSNKQYDISRCTLPMLTSDCLYQWSWINYGWLCSQQHWCMLPSGFCSLARRGSHAIFLLSELCYALNVCRRQAQKLSVLACLFPLLAVTSRYNFLRTLDWYHHS
jgi:hypothetical protein